MEATTQLGAILPAVERLVARIEPAQLEDPTPCDDFTVLDVIQHMTVLGSQFAYQFRGESPPEIEAPKVYGWVPRSEFQEAMGRLRAAVDSPGAMERTIAAPFGDVDGDTFARFVAFDGLVHGWDIARAIGRDYEVDDVVVAEVDAFARQALTDDMRDGDTFAAATTPPADAGPIDRLAAFSGRTV